MSDNVNHPKHYTSHPSGVECIQVTEHMGFNLGNAMKYLWRADEKGAPIEDLEKAVWYIQREISKRKRAMPSDARFHIEKVGPDSWSVTVDGNIMGYWPTREKAEEIVRKAQR
jgi:hypothetical protein